MVDSMMGGWMIREGCRERGETVGAWGVRGERKQKGERREAWLWFFLLGEATKRLRGNAVGKMHHLSTPSHLANDHVI